MKIIITGSVGTGKTTLAKKLAKKLKYNYLDINEIIRKNKQTIHNYDSLRQTQEIDTRKLNKILLPLLKKNKNIILDSHLSHYLPQKYVDLCIVCKCDLEELKKRLQKRKYTPLKIRENIEAEIFEVCFNEALETGHAAYIFNSNKKLAFQQLLSFINKLLR